MADNKKIIAAIACVDSRFGIGKENRLLVRIPEDMEEFARLTRGGVVIMGRKTYESLPNGALPGRVNLVVTRNGTGDPDYPRGVGPTTITMEQAKDYLRKKAEGQEPCKVCVIGGGIIYRELLPYCEVAYVTKLFRKFEADTYFPNLDRMEEWDLVAAGDICEFEGVPYQFCRYRNGKFCR